MDYKLVSFKGDNEGITISIKDSNMEKILEEIEYKIDKSKDFFKGAKVREITGEKLDKHDIAHIKNFLIDNYGMRLVDREKEEEDRENLKSIRRQKETTQKEVFKKREKKNIKKEDIPMEKIREYSDHDEEKTKLIRGTVRSGQKIEYDGNIVILGDVNPGGVISADGNIVVFGTLKGIAKAGARGDRKAYIVANDLEPTQLMIADIITRKPDENYIQEKKKSKYPEIASIQENMIIIEAY